MGLPSVSPSAPLHPVWPFVAAPGGWPGWCMVVECSVLWSRRDRFDGCRSRVYVVYFRNAILIQCGEYSSSGRMFRSDECEGMSDEGQLEAPPPARPYSFRRTMLSVVVVVVVRFVASQDLPLTNVQACLNTRVLHVCSLFLSVLRGLEWKKGFLCLPLLLLLK